MTEKVLQVYFKQFQFHFGTIKTGKVLFRLVVLLIFQLHFGTIKTVPEFVVKCGR